MSEAPAWSSKQSGQDGFLFMDAWMLVKFTITRQPGHRDTDTDTDTATGATHRLTGLTGQIRRKSIANYKQDPDNCKVQTLGKPTNASQSGNLERT